eukprot:6085554-Prorocentrum_lima.AAC.1
MTSSLVGSEMCIRDSWSAGARSRLTASSASRVHQSPASVSRVAGTTGAVSYTHLTLPTSVDLGGR